MHARREGLTRAASAPAVLAGAIAVLWWLDGPWDRRTAIAGFMLWAFLSGGILDRYARDRPTRARGFFGACGAHVSAMLRLGVLIVIAHKVLHDTLGARAGNPYVLAVAVLLLSIVLIVAVYGQIRLVVEDRRSAIGSLLAAARFVRRNPAGAAILVVFAAAIWGWITAMDAIAPAVTGRTAAVLLTALRLTGMAYLVLALNASGIALFQSRLAHAGYTAAPPQEWPDSPAAEAIVNASRRPS